ncbi:MAG TPA: M20/M25/M40 family metallo-hydrolase [Bacteroidales bacterium]|nr:M20/M25/M40 family metallo-hydrolase [Bacteroidales bacterium]
MKHNYIFALLISTLFNLIFEYNCYSQTKLHVDAEYIKDVVSDIASDDYQGRETGTAGCVMAEDYFAAELQKLGLKPAGDSGSWFFNYSIPKEEFDLTAGLTIDNRSFFQGYNEDFSVVYKSEPGDVQGDIVFAGYGIYNPEKNRNDFDTLDLKNKIVLMKRGAPRNDIQSWMPSCIDSVKAAYCYEHGAVGVLFYEPLIRTNQRILKPTFGNHLAMVRVIPCFPVFSIDERVVRFIFSQMGQSYYRINNLIETQPESFATKSTCHMSASGKKNQSIHTRDVLGMIKGTDRTLKDEFIVIGGHIDHLGADEHGKLWNGADDNASGPAVALGIARAMIMNKYKPRRSIIFAAWTGEEMGLLGSKAWCDRPTVDASKIVVYFNLDMVAVGNGKLNMPGTAYGPELADFIKENLDTALLRNIIWSDGGISGSDHSNFLNLGIPAFAGMTAGSHPDYHQPGDDPEKISKPVLQFTGDFIAACVTAIADSRSDFNRLARQEENQMRLMSFSFYQPISLSSCNEKLSETNFRQGLVNFSKSQPSADQNANFIGLLADLDSALQKNNNKYVFSTSAYDAMMTREGLLAAFNPADVGMDDLKLKVLASQGYRIAIVDSKNVICTDTARMRHFLTICHQNGLGVILNNLPVPCLEAITSESVDPVLIMNSEFLSDRIFSNIKAKGHLIIFALKNNDIINQENRNLARLIELAGDDHILICPSDLAPEDLRYLKMFVRQYSKSAKDKSLQYKLLNDNFRDFAVKSMQPNL